MLFEPASRLLAFVLPASFKKGEVTFIAPRTGQDVRLPIPVSNSPRHVVSTAGLPQGTWRTQLVWSDGQQQYHEEGEIMIL